MIVNGLFGAGICIHGGNPLFLPETLLLMRITACMACLGLLIAACKKDGDNIAPTIDKKIIKVSYNSSISFNYSLEYTGNQVTKIISEGADTMYLYYSGERIERAERHYNTSIGVITNKVQFTYDNDLLKKVFITTEGYPQEYITCNYFYKGSKVDSIGYDLSPTGFLGQSNKKFRYDNSGNLINVRFYSQTGQVVQEENYTYSKSVNPLRKLKNNFSAVASLIYYDYYGFELSRVSPSPGFYECPNRIASRKVSYPDGLIKQQQFEYITDAEGKALRINRKQDYPGNTVFTYE